MLTVTKRFEFDAAHKLPYHEGLCKNLHGHRYILEITIKGEPIEKDPPTPNQGMIIDFGTLSKIVKRFFLKQLDHSYLNDFYDNPTAELMVTEIGKSLQAVKVFEVHKVRLYETPNSWAEWTAE